MAEIQIEFLSSQVLSGKQPKQKLDAILDLVKKGKIVVLEEPLSATEEAELISVTMSRIGSKFPGIEISRLGESPDGIRAAAIKLLGGKSAGLTIVGPSSLVRQIKRNPGKLSVFAGK